MTAWGLCVLLRSVDKNLALLFLVPNAALLLPAYPAIHYPGLVRSFLAELGLALLLLLKDVKVVDAGVGPRGR